MRLTLFAFFISALVLFGLNLKPTYQRAEEGCGMDPNGACVSGPASPVAIRAPLGSCIDPDGKCSTNGVGVDPNG